MFQNLKAAAAVLLVVAMLVGLTACSGGESSGDSARAAAASVGWDTSNLRSLLLGSTDGASFSTLAEFNDDRFISTTSGVLRASIMSYRGQLYAGSSSNGKVYKVE